MTIHRARHFVLIVICSMLTHRAYGQTAAVGDRVRIVDSYKRNSLMQGTLVRFAGDSVIVASDTAGASTTGTAWFIGAQNSMERSAGLEGNVGRGAGLGLLIGAIAGGVVAVVNYDECGSSCPFSGAAFVVTGVVALGLGGTLVGGVVGAVFKTERWEPVAGHPIALRIAPTARRGILLGAAMTF